MFCRRALEALYVPWTPFRDGKRHICVRSVLPDLAHHPHRSSLVFPQCSFPLNLCITQPRWHECYMATTLFFPQWTDTQWTGIHELPPATPCLLTACLPLTAFTMYIELDVCLSFQRDPTLKRLAAHATASVLPMLAQVSVKPQETVYSHVVDRKVGVMGIFRTVATFTLTAGTQRITNGPGVPSGERVMVTKE